MIPSKYPKFQEPLQMRKLSTILLRTSYPSYQLSRFQLTLQITPRFFSSTSENHCCDDPNHHHTSQNPQKPFEKRIKVNLVSTFNDENFNEILVFPSLLKLSQEPWSKKSEDNLTKLYLLILRNLKKINIPESLIMAIDKSRYLPRNFIKTTDKRAILDRAIEIFEKNYFCKQDKGDCLRSIIFVSTLSKYEFTHSFYEKIMEKSLKEIDDIDIIALKTIIEGFTFNKINVKSEIAKKFALAVFAKFGQLSIRELKIYPRIMEILIYRLKNFPDLKEAEVLNPLISKYCNNILTFCFNEKNLKNQVFRMIEFVNYLSQYNEALSTSNQQLLFLNKQITAKIDLYFEKTELKKLFFIYPSVLEFQTSFFNGKAQYLPPKLLFYFKNNLLEYPFENLKNLTIYLYFIAKHSDNFMVPLEINKKIMSFLELDKNLPIIIKLFDAYSSVKPILDKNSENFALQEEILNKMEEKTLMLCKKNNYPMVHFTALFQYLNYLNRGKLENWLFFFNYFSQKIHLEEVDIFSLIVKLIPTAANKAKQEFKLITNVSLNMTPVSSYLKDNSDKTGLVIAIETFWGILEDHLVPLLPRIYPDKYPSVLMHFVYANLSYRKFFKVHENLKDPILKNLDKFTEKQLSGILYSYSRVLVVKDMTEFFMKISENLKVRILKNPQNFMDYELSNICWAYSIARVYDRQLLDLIDGLMIKQIRHSKLQSFTEYIRGLSNFDERSSNQAAIEASNAMIIERIKEKKEKIELPHVFIWAHSFVILNNNQPLIWKTLLGYIVNNKSLMNKDDFQHYYLYLLYLHLLADENLKKELVFELENVKKILLLEKKAILNYLSKTKKKSISKNEGKVVKIIEQNEKELFPEYNEKNEGNILEISKNGVKFLFLDDFNLLQKEDFSNDFLEKFMIIPFATDLRKGNILIEHNGRIHYFYDVDTKKYLLNGVTSVKKKFLDQLGLKYVELPFYVGEEEKDVVEFLKEKLKI